MKGIVELLVKPISAKDLAQKWQISESRLKAIVQQADLPFFTKYEGRRRPDDGVIVYLCSGLCSVKDFNLYKGHFDDWPLGYMYFDVAVVEEYEREHQKILWKKEPKEKDPLHLAVEDSAKYQAAVKTAAEYQCQQWLLEKGYLTVEQDREVSCANKSEESPAIAAQPDKIQAYVWERSVSAAYQLSVESIESERKWTYDDFANALTEKYSKFLPQILDIAWDKLPSKFKLESSSPKESPATADCATVDTTVQPIHWENTANAAFELLAEISENKETNWKYNEFKAALTKKCSKGYHTKVLAIAWSNLPKKFKHGPGREKKPSETTNI